MTSNKNTHVIAALSGGVDSAVAAALLVEQGYKVTGAFIKIWQPEFLECTWEKDRLDAMRVAATLGIPFLEVDLSKEYAKSVIDDMLSAYTSGTTPNPDVLCNRHIKFGAFLNAMRSHGAEYIATGHHARCETHGEKHTLLRGADPNKDQSYFLWQLTQADLERSLFPVGTMTKDAVRREAHTRHLPSAHKPDSQGLCFVGDVDMRTFLKRYIPTQEGKVLSPDGTTIGTHEGAALYTLGERHGFSVTDPTRAGSPHYITAIDVTNNTITAAPTLETALRNSVALTHPNWISGSDPVETVSYAAEVRYHQGPQACTIQKKNANWIVQFEQPQLAVPGQSLVLYDGDTCFGGGVIM